MTKHINIKVHFFKNISAQVVIAILKIPKLDNPTNIITKHILTVKFQHCLDLTFKGVSKAT